MTGTLWERECGSCDHPMSEHFVDLKADQRTECRAEGCTCTVFVLGWP